MIRRLVLSILLPLASACSTQEHALQSLSQAPESLSKADVGKLTAQAVETAQSLGESMAVAVIDREGNLLGFYRMTGVGLNTRTPALQKARTAAYLSSNQHAFSTLTACFIIQSHYPPGVANAPGGPLYGVQFSSLQGGDVQPNGSGLSGAPGAVPLFKQGQLVGALAVEGASGSFDGDLCAGITNDEIIAATAVRGFAPATDKRGDAILVDGIQLLFQNAASLPLSLSLNPASLPQFGSFDVGPMDAPAPKFSNEGEIVLGPGFDFRITGGIHLTKSEVNQIISQAVLQANRTRAAIRRPLGSPARVFVSVCDVNGEILGIWRTPDATLFSFDVSAQKARTALAFSDPSHSLGKLLRTTLGLPANTPLAMTTRALGFISQDFFPPGIDQATLDRPVREGPLFGLQDSLGTQPFGNGITIFPGGLPLYRNGELVGAIGVSGDGVDQDDLIASAGAQGFAPPSNIRSDQFRFREVRLPYVKFPRQPEIQ